MKKKFRNSAIPLVSADPLETNPIGNGMFPQGKRNLPRDCDWGTKKDSKGKKQNWCGYKVHLDAIDGDIPISWQVTSASLHDSQVAIPLAQMSAGRVISLYDLADAAYDAREIRQMSDRLGHVALIDHNPRRGEKRQFTSPEAVRYRQRNSAERVNSHLHDNHGGRHVRVRGAVTFVNRLPVFIITVSPCWCYLLIKDNYNPSRRYLL
jgi:hypothetical protein